MRRKLRRVVTLCGLAAVGLIVYIVSSLDRGHQVDLVQRKIQGTRPIETTADIKKPAVEAADFTSVPAESAHGRPNQLSVAVASAARVRTKEAISTEENIGSPTPGAGAEVAAETKGLDLRRSKGLGVGSDTSAGKSTVDTSMRNEEVLPPLGESTNADVSPALMSKGNFIPTDPGESRVAVKAVAKSDPAISGDLPFKEKPVAKSVTMADAQPLIANLLHQLETGRGNNLLTVMDSDARRESSALAFASYYDGLVGGARTVKLSQVELRPEMGAGRLLVTGFVRLQLGDDVPSMKRLTLRAEFVSRGGTVVMTRLTGMEAVDR